jgi:hypothetical protein
MAKVSKSGTIPRWRRKRTRSYPITGSGGTGGSHSQKREKIRIGNKGLMEKSPYGWVKVM